MDCTGRVTEYRYCGLLSFAASSHPCKPFGPLPNPAMATCIQPALPLPTSQGQQIALNPRQWCGRFMKCSNVVKYVVGTKYVRKRPRDPSWSHLKILRRAFPARHV
ncbi:hypothetical protein CCUS01_00370 [Colletotrichum cuscutae]|uniref:Uncharacterized protein n=1 Tax=Colletotrichum cuscutae TaxID=1209917 RepID=A0AAI9VCJ6_9PEZI|nr:hypothetical protein CCUS01_00370 [Colletotrichum cuscutae]